MMDSVQKREFTIFKNSCRVYEKECEESQKLLFLYPDLKEMVNVGENGEIHEKSPVFLSYYNIDPLIVKEYELILYDLWYVDERLDKIEKLFGSEAKEICKDLFVNQQTQDICAEDHGMTRDQLQYLLSKWILESFGASEHE